jgi:hypothetical protein
VEGMFRWTTGGNLEYKIQIQYQQIMNVGITEKAWFMVFNATFNNISVISWQLVSLMEETGVP